MQFKVTFNKTRQWFSKTAMVLALLCFALGTTVAQSLTNGNLSTGANSSNGVAAPTGYTWSEVQAGNGTAGFGGSVETGYALADNFVVPAGQTWYTTTIRVYGYSTGYAGTSSPFDEVRIAIYNTDPSVGSPAPIAGDLTTNRLVGSGDASMYRIFNATTGTTRKVWYIDAGISTALTAGTYWIVYQPGTAGNITSFYPPSTVVGTVTQAGNNAKQLQPGNTWAALLDGSNPQDLPFTVNYTTTCTVAGTPTASASPIQACAGSPVTLTATGALNNSANWKWYTGSCGGTLVGTGASITVNPSATTTYYVRGEGNCPGNGACGQVTVTVTPCTCMTPDLVTICEGQIQQLSLTMPAGAVQTFNSTGTTTIPSSGTATPYPSTINVSGLTTHTLKRVRLNGLSHTWPSDIDIVLVPPAGSTGQPVILMSDVGGSSAINGVNLLITDAATAALPTSAIASGTYLPTNSGATDNFPAPGPGSLTQATPTVNSANGSVMNGAWTLYIVDDTGGDSGSLTSWSLEFEINPLPSATWTGGTIFSNAAATVPYVAGTPAQTVWVQPSTTTTYTANISNGAAGCNGNQQVTVTVLPRPVVSITPNNACAPVNLVATGAASYVWSPATGLSATTGSTVTANPAASTTYTVIGTGTNGCASAPTTVSVNAAPTAATITKLPSYIYQLGEGFDGTALPASWTNINRSNPLGTQNWFPGNTGVFGPQSGAGYAAANWANTTTSGTGTISSWLISPVLNIKNGDIISFYTRTTTGTFPDRLQLRMSTAGGSTNVGTTETTVGDFTTLMVDINPTLSTTGYPTTWTRYTATVAGVSGTVTGRFAFRYFVTNGGGTGANSDYIGVDSVNYFTPQPFTCPNTVSNLAINITGGVGPYTVVYSNGTTNTTINGYVSGSPIQVSPATTTTYTIVSVTGANGCVGTGISATGATVNVTQPGSIATQPANATIECGGNTSFTVAGSANSGISSYQWQVSTDGGTTWANVTNGGVYSGATTATLTLTNLPVTPYNGYKYRVVLEFACTTPSTVTSNAATLTVNQLTAVVSPNPATICQGQIQKLMITNINSPAPATSSYSSGPITLAIPDNNPTGVTNAITVPAIVGSGQLLGVKVTVNMTHTWTGDVIMALKAPGGQIANFDWLLSGTGASGGGLGLVNTTFSSNLTLPLISTGSAPYTGTFRFDNVGPTANPAGTPTALGAASSVVGINALIAATANPAGTWTLGAYDAGGGDVGTITSWSLELTYMLGAPSTGVWGPTAAIGTIFTDPAATVPYVAGTPLNTVYVKPNATTTYTVVVSTPTPCTSGTTSIPVTVHTPLTGTASVANKTVCVGANTKFFMATTPGGMAAGVYYQWQVLTSSTGTWTNVTNAGVYTGATTDTLRITGATNAMNGYQYRVVVSNACNTAGIASSAGTITVDNPSAVISSTGTSVFPGQTVTLTATPTSGTGTAYQWYYNGAAIAGATTSTYVVDVDHAGGYTVVVTNSNGCTTAQSASFAVGYTESTNLWIYPSPNTGVFQVRYYNQSPSTPRFLNIYDAKGSRVWVSGYSVGVGYTRMDVDLRKFGKGTYAVELTDRNGDRIKVGRVLVL